MQQVRVTKTVAEAYLIKDALLEEGIHARVRGEHLIPGEAPELLPSVWISDADAHSAGELLRGDVFAADRSEALVEMESEQVAVRGERVHPTLTEPEDPMASDQAGQAVMSDVFLVADRLRLTPRRGDLHDEIRRLHLSLAVMTPPFGVSAATWEEATRLSAAVVTAVAAADEEDIQSSAKSLRDFLRDYV